MHIIRLDVRFHTAGCHDYIGVIMYAHLWHMRILYSWIQAIRSNSQLKSVWDGFVSQVSKHAHVFVGLAMLLVQLLQT